MPARIPSSLLLLPSTSRLPSCSSSISRLRLPVTSSSCCFNDQKLRHFRALSSKTSKKRESLRLPSTSDPFPSSSTLSPLTRRLPNRTWARAFAHLASKEPESQNKPAPEKKEAVSALAKQRKAPDDDPTPTGLKAKAGGKEQRLQDIQIVKRLLPNIWPKGDSGTKARVLVAIGLLVGGKLLNVQVPFYFKSIVDSLNIPIAELSAEQTAWTIGGTAIVGCEQYLCVRFRDYC